MTRTLLIAAAGLVALLALGILLPGKSARALPPAIDLNSSTADLSRYGVPAGDSDGDTVPDGDDLCPETPGGETPDENGCSDAQVDGDGDGYCDPYAPSDGPSECTGSDNCPYLSNPTQVDDDNDGAGDDCEPAGCVGVVDCDGDGCADGEELGWDERLGGWRDPENPSDFYDVPVPTAFGTPLAAYYHFAVDTDAVLGMMASNTMRAQGFKSSKTATVDNGVLLYLKKTGAPADDLILEIQSDNGGVPSGTAIPNGTSQLVSGAGLSSQYYYQIGFTFTVPPNLTAGTQYHLVLSRSGAVDLFNFYVWGIDMSSPTYADGQEAVYNGTVWTSEEADAAFMVYGLGGTLDDRDGAVTVLNDVLAVLEYSGTSDDGPRNSGWDGVPGTADDRDYDQDNNGDTLDDGLLYDRSVGVMWSDAPDGAIIILTDVLLVLRQCGHSCIAPP